MGFIEDLRQEVARVADTPIGIKKRADGKTSKLTQELQLGAEAKRQFDESGLKDLIDILVKIKPELKFEPNVASSSCLREYLCQVVLVDVDLLSFRPHLQTRVFIEIATAHDGTIRFSGDKERGSSVVPKNIWAGNESILEEALGKAYENPQRREYDPSQPHAPWGGIS